MSSSRYCIDVHRRSCKRFGSHECKCSSARYDGGEGTTSNLLSLKVEILDNDWYRYDLPMMEKVF